MKSLHATLSSFAVFALAGCATLQVHTDYDPEMSLTQFSTYDWVERDADADASSDPALDSPLLKRHIRDAVQGELGRLGYRKVTSDTPDFRGYGEDDLGPPDFQGYREDDLGRTGDPKVTSDTPDLRISYRLIAEEKSRINGSYGYGPYGYGFGSYGFGGAYGYSPYSYRRSFGFSRFGGRGFSPYYGYSGARYAGTSYVREYLQGTLVLDIIDVRTEEVIFRGWARKSLDSDPSPEKVRKYVTEAVAEILEDFPPAGVHVNSRLAPFGEAVER